MGFRSIESEHLAKFNSASSCEFLEFYNDFIDGKVLDAAAKTPSRTIAPSSFRCSRKTWFRLRGVEPDVPDKADKVLNFTAELGTACHQIMQSNLIEALGDNWISVESYLTSIQFPYSCQLKTNGLETRVKILDPPINFSVDGIIRWKGYYYLLEIKTCEYSSFRDLTGPKDQHIDQVKIYATLLGLKKALVVYQDRQYGDIKVYELSISVSDNESVMNKIQHIQDMVQLNLAPERLPKGDSWCNQCNYRTKCSQWGD